jgi:hypothetical protein
MIGSARLMACPNFEAGIVKNRNTDANQSVDEKDTAKGSSFSARYPILSVTTNRKGYLSRTGYNHLDFIRCYLVLALMLMHISIPGTKP